MNIENKAKKNVLEEIMRLMDERENESLKKHPKLMKVSVLGKDQEDIKEGLETAEDVVEQEPLDMMDTEVKDPKDEIDPEMMQKLIEMYKSLK